MQDLKLQGIVLSHQLPRKQKVLLFDQNQGPIEAVPDSRVMAHRLCRGALIHYHLRDQRGVHFLHAVDIIDIPFAWAREDILFLHHILELCAFFMPQASSQIEIFNHLQALYALPAERSSLLFKKLFLVKFFLLIGMYPESHAHKLAFLHEMTRESIDVLAKRHVHLELGIEVDSWLTACIHQHPQIASLKTAQFIQS